MALSEESSILSLDTISDSNSSSRSRSQSQQTMQLPHPIITKGIRGGGANINNEDYCHSSESNQANALNEEDVYLRRMSVLYHEMWQSNHVVHPFFDFESSAGRSLKDTMQPTLKESSDTFGQRRYRSGTSSNKPKLNPDYRKSRYYPKSPLTDVHTEDSQSGGNINRQHTSCFSSPDLVDALLGTVRRLEDDPTLLQHRRWNTIKELAITEAHYLRDLLLMRTVFYEPLVGIVGCALLRPEDTKVVFGNLDQIIDCTRSLVEHLTVAVVYEANRCCALRSDCSGDSSSLRIPEDTRKAIHEEYGSSCLSSTPLGTRNSVAAFPGSSSDLSNRNHRLKHSVWADISIARSFLTASARMERVYSQYCRNFESASQRLVEIKQLSSTIPFGVITPNTMPSTPHFHGTVANRRSYAATTTTPSVAADNSGSAPSKNKNSIANSLHISSSSGRSSGHFDRRNHSTHVDLGNPDAMYSAVIHQFITEQAQFLSGKTTSWDLPSLLIKPVQRILKYPLLIRSILGLTTPSSLDYSQLEKAAHSVERVAGIVNTPEGVGGRPGSSNALASTEENQSRITRELRRVLRRPRNGNAVVSTNKETQAKEKKRLASTRPKSRGATAAAVSSNGAAIPTQQQFARPLPSHPPISVEMEERAIEKHEQQISGLVSSIRKWENTLGTALFHQSALITCWKDAYGSGSYTSPSATPNPHAFLKPRSARSQSTLKTSRPCLSAGKPTTDPLMAFAEGDGLFALPVTERSASARSNDYNPNSDSDGQSLWISNKKQDLAQYEKMLRILHKIVYPQLVCQPLHSNVYPVLESLLTVYKEGPRKVLAELSSNRSSISTSSAEHHDENRRMRLHQALVDDLPKLFDHEKTVVGLLFSQVRVIQRNFYRRAVAELAKVNSKTTAFSWEDGQNQWLSVYTGSTRSSPFGRHNGIGGNAKASALKQSTYSNSNTGWSEKAIVAHERRWNRRNGAGLGLALPSASECMSQVKASMRELSQDMESISAPANVLKPRRRQSEIDLSGFVDVLTPQSLDGGYSEPSSSVTPSNTTDDSWKSKSFYSPKRNAMIATPAYSQYAEDGYDDLGIPNDSRNAEEILPRNSNIHMSWLPVESPVRMPQSSKPTSHVRKKSSGFIDRITQLRPGRLSKGQQLKNTLSKMELSRLSGSDGEDQQIKSRAKLGLAIDMADSGSFLPLDGHNSVLVSYPETDASSTATTSGSLNGNDPDSSNVKYEPLPSVDSTRLSKGFIDSTMELMLGTLALDPIDDSSTDNDNDNNSIVPKL